MFKPAGVVRSGLWDPTGGGGRLLGKLQNHRIAEPSWKRRAIEGDSPVCEILVVFLGRVPEYVGARETLTESGGTILQG